MYTSAVNQNTKYTTRGRLPIVIQYLSLVTGRLPSYPHSSPRSASVSLNKKLMYASAVNQNAQHTTRVKLPIVDQYLSLVNGGLPSCPHSSPGSSVSLNKKLMYNLAVNQTTKHTARVRLLIVIQYLSLVNGGLPSYPHSSPGSLVSLNKKLMYASAVNQTTKYTARVRLPFVI